MSSATGNHSAYSTYIISPVGDSDLLASLCELSCYFGLRARVSCALYSRLVRRTYTGNTGKCMLIPALVRSSVCALLPAAPAHGQTLRGGRGRYPAHVTSVSHTSAWYPHQWGRHALLHALVNDAHAQSSRHGRLSLRWRMLVERRLIWVLHSIL